MLVASLSRPDLGLDLRGLPQSYDPVFNRHRGSIPVEYLRALAKRESDFNIRESGGSYWGLLQVGKNDVLPSYNKRHGTSYTAEDLFNPEVNVTIAVELLHRIITAYSKHSDPNLRENWGNPEFVKLLTAGWNSGYSEAAGVGHVASWLEARGMRVTHDNVFQYAAQAGATKHLSNTSKQAWQRSVADLFYQELGAGPPVALNQEPTKPRVGVAVAGLAILAGVSYVAWRQGWFT